VFQLAVLVDIAIYKMSVCRVLSDQGIAIGFESPVMHKAIAFGIVLLLATI
jgi:hypothetical protein